MNTGVPPAGALLPLVLPVELIDRLPLRDGREVVLRPVLPQDGNAEEVFFRGLSLLSRYRRFHAGLPALPLALLERMIGVDQRTHVAVVAQPASPAQSVLKEPGIVADARYVLDANGTVAEFALAVADEWQGLGLGRRLLQALARHAARRGVHELRGDVLMDNRPMIGLVEHLGGEFDTVRGEPGVLQARFTLRAAAQGIVAAKHTPPSGCGLEC